MILLFVANISYGRKLETSFFIKLIKSILKEEITFKYSNCPNNNNYFIISFPLFYLKLIYLLTGGATALIIGLGPPKS